MRPTDHAKSGQVRCNGPPSRGAAFYTSNLELWQLARGVFCTRSHTRSAADYPQFRPTRADPTKLTNNVRDGIRSRGEADLNVS